MARRKTVPEDLYRGVQSENAELTRELDDVRHDYTEIQSEHALLETEHESTRQELQHVKKNSRVKTIIFGVLIGIAVLSTAGNITQAVINSNLRQENQAIYAQLEEYKDFYDNYSFKIEELESTISDLEEKNAVTQRELDEVKAQLKEAEDAIAKKEAEIAALKTENEDLRKQIQEKQAEIDALQDSIDGYQARIEELEGLLSQDKEVEVDPSLPSNPNGNVSVGDNQNQEDVNENPSNIDREQGEFEPMQ